eukprot:461698_1
MSIRLNIGDAVLVQMAKNDTVIGLIKYMGPMIDDMMSEYVGIEFMEPIEYGHNGTVNGFTYFIAQNGYGFHCKLINIIRKLNASELITKLRDLYILLKLKTQYIKRLEYIIPNKKPEIPSKIKISLTETTEIDDEKYIMPKRLSLDSKISITESITETKNEFKQITPIRPKLRLRNSTSVTDTHSLSMSRTHGKLTDHTDHEFSLSSTESDSHNKKSNSNSENSESVKSNKTKLKYKRKSKSSYSSSLDLSPIPHSDVCNEQINSKIFENNIYLKQSQTQIFGGNINISYNNKQIKSSVYIKNLPSLSELSKSPKSPSSTNTIGLAYFRNKSQKT